MTTPDPMVNMKRPPRGDGTLRRHALVVGIDGYLAPTPRLSFCAADAVRLRDVLAGRGYAVTLVHDGPGAKSKPTLARVRAALTTLMEAADADDLVVVYFSCHGRLVGGRPHLMMADTPADDDGLITRGLPLATLLADLRGERTAPRPPPRWVAIFLDVCHMGLGLDPTIGESAGRSAARAGGFALLAGSTTAQITQDTTDAGVFSKVLIDGLTGGAADALGTVRFSALARHVQAGVAAWRETTDGETRLAAQTPVLRLEVADLELLPAHAYLDLAPTLSAKITDASWAPDGLRLATAAEDGTVRLWDAISGRPVLSTMRHEADDGSWGYVGGVAFASSGLVIASCSNNGMVRIWQASGANLVTPTPDPIDAVVTKVAWARGRPPGRPRWAAAASDGVHVYDGDTLARPVRHRLLEGHAGTVWTVAFTPDGQLVSGGIDGTVRFWDVDAGRCVATWQLDGPVWSVAVSPDGTRIATAGTDDQAETTLRNLPRIWDRASGAEKARLVGHRGGVTAIAYTVKGDRLATSSYDGTARVWAAADGRPLRTLTLAVGPQAERPFAYAASFAPAGDRLFVGYADGRGRLFTL